MKRRVAILGVLLVAGCAQAPNAPSSSSSPEPIASAAATASASPSAPPSERPTQAASSSSPSARPASEWSEPQRLGGGSCTGVAATIDTGGRPHVAASCAGSIRYSVREAGGEWSTTTFEHPKGREERDPQIAFDATGIYIAYSRVRAIPADGCGSTGDSVTDVGVYYRTRNLPDGVWSDARRLGAPDDQLLGMRVDGGTLHAIVGVPRDARTWYVTLNGSDQRRHPIGDGVLGSSLRVGSDGRARLAYVARKSLHYATFDGTAFSSEAIVETQFLRAPVLVLGPANQPHVLWTVDSQAGGGCASPDEVPEDGTYYGTRTNGVWTSERITGRTGPTSLTLDVDTGRLHALIGGDGLRYYTKDVTADWTGTRLAGTQVLVPPVIRLDPATGALLVAYVASDEGIPGDVFAISKP